MTQLDITKERTEVFNVITNLMQPPNLKLEYDGIFKWIQKALDSDYANNSTYNIVNYEKLIYIICHIDEICPDANDNLRQMLQRLIDKISKQYELTEKLIYRCFAEPSHLWDMEE